MKPTPDESREIGAPTTQGLFDTYADEDAGGGPPDSNPEATLEAKTIRADPEADPAPSQAGHAGAGWDQGQGQGPHTAWGSSSEVAQPSSQTSRRGVVGKIEPGQTLYSKYVVLRKLGGGAMGDVWLVRHVVLKSEHALKVIVPNFATNALALMRFQREFEVMATLRHEHAVTIYDACIDADGGYIDMEYVEGQTIHQTLGMARGRDGVDPSDPLMPLDWIARVLDQLCEVLQVAHEKGIVHRDLKPSNLMLVGGRPAGKEYLKVLDFGIAKIRDDPEGVAGRDQEAAEHKTQGFIGTPSYGSPEQAMGFEVDGRADLYSVGIMLYEFVTGRLPFRGNHWQVMSQNATAPPPTFAEANPRIRPMPELERAIFRVLAKKPEERPQTARELSEDVRRAVDLLLPAGSKGLSSTAEYFPARVPYSSTIGNLPSTHADGYGEEPPATEAATLVGKAQQSWKAKPAGESPSDIGRPPGTAGARNPLAALLTGRSPAARVGAVACLVALLAVIVGLVLMANRPGPKGLDSAVAGGTKDAGKAKISAPTSIDFERYWDKEYRPVEGYTRGMPWPEKVRRTTDEAVFIRFGDGIYLPETFTPENKDDLAKDGWPRVIVKNGLRFLRTPGDTWVMGAWDDANAVDRADAPAHPVTLTGYYLQETEVTHGRVEDYLNQEDVSAPTDWDRNFKELRRKVGPDLARTYPASSVSRDLASRFARWMGGQLPTEAQWEYAARSLGQRRHYVWGDAPHPDRNLANVDSLNGSPAPVGSFPKDRTEQGVLDLTGNVQEMCRDAWISTYSKKEDAEPNPCALAKDPDRDPYSIRGGYYGSIGKECVTTRRDDNRTAAELAENIGFRLVVECPDARKPR